MLQSVRRAFSLLVLPPHPFPLLQHGLSVGHSSFRNTQLLHEGFSTGCRVDMCSDTVLSMGCRERPAPLWRNSSSSPDFDAPSAVSHSFVPFSSARVVFSALCYVHFPIYELKESRENPHKIIYKSINKSTNRRLERNNITWVVFYKLTKNPVG